jgi:hypothetical protein
MNIQQWTTCLCSAALLSACGGGGDKNNEITDFIPADGGSSYTGQRTFAALNTNNAPAYLSMFYGPGFDSPSLSFRSTQGITLVKNDFLHDQDRMLRYVKQKALPTQYMQRTVTETTDCENEGTLKLEGNAEDSSSKGKINLNYNNCQFGGYIFNGNAYLFIYATNGSFEEISSATISYNGLKATPTGGGEAFIVTGTLDEVFDYNTNSTRTLTQLHRKTINTGKQTLLDTTRQYYDFDSTIQVSGSVYHGTHGRAKISTLQPMIYNAEDIPLAGVVLMKGAANSKIKVTALGEQYSIDQDENLIMLQVEVDADGDGVYENTSQVNTNDL